MIGKIPVITMHYIEHCLKHISEFTMKIVMDEIKELDDEEEKE